MGKELLLERMAAALAVVIGAAVEAVNETGAGCTSIWVSVTPHCSPTMWIHSTLCFVGKKSGGTPNLIN